MSGVISLFKVLAIALQKDPPQATFHLSWLNLQLSHFNEHPINISDSKQEWYAARCINMVNPKIFLEWLTSYDDRLKSEVATWLWFQHIGSDFCSHSCDLCNHDLGPGPDWVQPQTS